MKITEFNIAALFLLSVILASTYIKGFTKGKTNKAFLLLIIEVLVTTIAGTIAAYLDNSGAGYVDGKFFAHGIYLLLHNLSALFFMAFIVILTDRMYFLGKSRLKMVLFGAPWIIVAVLLIVNCFTPVLFVINMYGVYTRLPAFVLLYVLSILYIVYSIVHIVRYRKLFTTKWIVSLFSFYPVVGIAMLIEYLNPLLMIEPFANAITFLFIGYGVMHPEDYLDGDTGYNSKFAYYEDCTRILYNQKPVYEIHFNIINYENLRDILNYEDSRKLIKKTADYIYGCAADERIPCSLYNLENGSFALHIDQKHSDKISQIAEDINAILKCQMTFGNVGVTQDACVCVIRIPEDVETFDELISIGKNFAQEKYVEDVYYADKLLNDRYFNQLVNLDRIIEKAYNEKRISVYYQAIYSFEQKRFVCAEALARLKDEEYGYIPPSMFIPAAEKSGAIIKIGDYILEEVCKFVASSAFKDLGLEFIDVNLSAVQCMQYNLAEHVDRFVYKYGISRDKINLEITETAAVLAQDMFVRNMDDLKKKGFSISLDDFGTGYSNITRLSEIPFNVVKLDKSLADVIENDEHEKLPLVQNIVQLVSGLGYKLVIEGVESKKTLDEFERLGCDYVQGYYFAKPLPMLDFVNFLSEESEGNNQ